LYASNYKAIPPKQIRQASMILLTFIPYNQCSVVPGPIKNTIIHYLVNK